MKKVSRILLFHGDDICYNTLNEFSDILAGCLTRQGIEVGFIDLSQKGDSLADEYVREMNKGFDAAIAFDSMGQERTYMGDDNVFEYMQVPFFNWIVDHPGEHLASMKNTIKDYHIICIDRDHEDYVKRFFPNVTGVHFIPLGGMSVDKSDFYTRESFEQRKYDVIFTGSHIELGEIAENIRNLPDKLPQICMEMVECMLEDRMINTENALKLVLKNNSVDTDIEEFKDYMFMISPATYYLRAYIREEIIRYLAESDVKIDLFGIGWDKIGSLGNISTHESVTYPESVRLCTETKISLNVMPLFRNGLHDRIPSAMLGGSAVMTDSSRYIEQIFNTDNKRELIIFDASHPELVAEQMINALNDTDNLFDIACRGMSKAKEMLSWEKRTNSLISIIENC